jgi:hypothetical protein
MVVGYIVMLDSHRVSHALLEHCNKSTFSFSAQQNPSGPKVRAELNMSGTRGPSVIQILYFSTNPNSKRFHADKT